MCQGSARRSPHGRTAGLMGMEFQSQGWKKIEELTVIVTVSSRHMDVSTALKAHATEKSQKLLKYYDRIQEIEVVIDAGPKDGVEVEVMVNGEHKSMFIAKEQGPDAYKCIDACVNKLERQLTDHHKKLKNRKHPG
jgi:putative sigma-54 modulation protein